MFVEENNRIFVVENNQVVASFVKEAYYGSCPHPDCEEHGKTKYDIKKNENCKACGTSMKVEFPKGKKKQDSDTESKKESAMQNVTADLDPVGEEDEDIDNDGITNALDPDPWKRTNFLNGSIPAHLKLENKEAQKYQKELFTRFHIFSLLYWRYTWKLDFVTEILIQTI